MFEVTLVKRFYLLILVALIAWSATACTRDKPPEPTPDLRLAISSSSSSASVSSSASASSVSSSIAITPTTPSATSSASSSAPVSSATPVPTMVPTPVPSPATSTPGTYTVKWGDWLNKIAAEHGVTVQAILAANPGLDPNLIYPGQVINLPTGDGSSSSSSSSASSSTSSASGTPSTYTVQRGDWIYAIARKFNVSVAALLAANPGIRPNLLYPGQQLNIPGGDSSGTTPPSAGTYVVKPGDTLFSIAVKFRTTVYAFQIKNNLANPHLIYPGQLLMVPQ